ncbi:tRNA adenosine(34) deaminase TadA [Rhodopirellula sp.]|nr:tRNA adenosine(34) deaminase TadA [Rhodopirellula sp.]
MKNEPPDRMNPAQSGAARLDPSHLDADAYWMGRALELAVEAITADEVPVGALIVKGGSVIAAASNQRETLKDPTAHAEMIAITQAASAIGDWRLEETTLYVTLEPCIMCAGAIVQSRIPRVVFGATDPKGGAVTTLYQILTDPRLNHQASITAGVLSEPCGRILTEFFASKRALGKK